MCSLVHSVAFLTLLTLLRCFAKWQHSSYKKARRPSLSLVLIARTSFAHESTVGITWGMCAREPWHNPVGTTDEHHKKTENGNNKQCTALYFHSMLINTAAILNWKLGVHKISQIDRTWNSDFRFFDDAAGCEQETSIILVIMECTIIQ